LVNPEIRIVVLLSAFGGGAEPIEFPEESYNFSAL